MFARVSKFEGGSLAAIEATIRYAQENVLPAARAMEGFEGLIGLADRSSGAVMSVTLWASEQAMRASEEAADRLREESLSEGEEIAAVERYEVVIYEPPTAD